MFYKIIKSKPENYAHNYGYKRNAYRKRDADLMVINRWEIKQGDFGGIVD